MVRALLQLGENMTFDEWWYEQPPRFKAPIIKSDAQNIWEAAIKAEREACAKVCDDAEASRYEWWDARADPADEGAARCAGELAQAIRARSNQP
jgi:hypothetical protein